jgi:hypothetical protein
MAHSDPRPAFDEPARYQIQVEGRIDERWSDWFHGLSLSVEDDVTTLSGKVVDQPALRGILSRLWDLSLVLVSVNRVDSESEKGDHDD